MEKKLTMKLNDELLNKVIILLSAQNGRNWESADRLPKSTRKAIILGKVFSQNRKMAAEWDLDLKIILPDLINYETLSDPKVTLSIQTPRKS